MTGDLHRIQEIGWKRNDGTFGDDPIVDGDETFYEFFDYATPFGDFPNMDTEIFQSYNGGSYDPASQTVASTKSSGSIAGIMINGLPFYFLNCRKESTPGLEDGGVVDDGGSPPTYTITPITNGEVSDYGVRYHTGNQVNVIRKTLPGVRYNSFTMSIDNTTKRSPLAATIGLLGLIPKDIQVNTLDYVLEKPDDLDTYFYWDNTAGSLLTWDLNGTPLELKEEMLSFAYTEDTLNRLTKISGQHYPNRNVTGDRIHIINMVIERRDSTKLFDDYLDQSGINAIPADDFKDLRFKISNALGRYIQCDFLTLGITSCKMNNAMIENKQTSTYQITALAKAIAPVIQDGITTKDFYGISA